MEMNFRDLDRQARERIATWEGSKGALLDEIPGNRDVIADSDQGKSFRAFWDFLMAPERQEELSELLARVFELDPVKELAPDRRFRRIHCDWLAAGEVTQHTVARLSAELRRLLDDKAWLENRRIMEILRAIEAQSLELRDSPPNGPVMELDGMAPDVRLGLDRPLFTPPKRPTLAAAIDHPAPTTLQQRRYSRLSTWTERRSPVRSAEYCSAVVRSHLLRLHQPIRCSTASPSLSRILASPRKTPPQ